MPMAESTRKIQEHMEKYRMPSPSDDEQMETFGYVVREMIEFRLRCKANDVDWVEDVLNDDFKKSRIKVNYFDSMGMIPLHWTAYIGLPEMTELLMKHGGDVKLKDTVNEWEPEIWAKYGKQQVDKGLVMDEEGDKVTEFDDRTFKALKGETVTVKVEDEEKKENSKIDSRQLVTE